MRRLIEKSLKEWKDSHRRKPLMILGVRQCGKTYSMKELGRREFPDYAYFNFESDEGGRLKGIFEKGLDTSRIIDDLSYVRGKRITPDTLIIFDEIQYCMRAIASLKYFCEEAPEYYIVCAGSLLGVKLHESTEGRSGDYSFPVGKVRFMNMYPMNFAEFLRETRGDLYGDLAENISAGETVPDAAMSVLEEAVREYWLVGGMPESVAVWKETRDIEAVREVQKDIDMSYLMDFSNHAPEDFPKLSAIWNSIARQNAKGNERFFFNEAVEGSRAGQLKDALQWLIDAGLVYRCTRVSSPDVPLTDREDRNIFKLYMADVGLMTFKSGVPAKAVGKEEEAYGLFRGALAENFVLTEMISSYGTEKPYDYWKNDRGISEVDFLLDMGGETIPIEVKSGRVPRLRSMEQYISLYNPRVAVLASFRNLGGEGKLRSVPLYLMWRVKDFIRNPERSRP
ncbi:ATP-binding protein [Methanomassiliicoccales archaeon LGM-DZ1]|nr:ATP-binding protein [Methanomassiliicoccales archaeon LGM-DZ1]